MYKALEIPIVILIYSEHFKGLDPFAEQKRRSLTESMTSVASLAYHLETELNALSESNDTEATQKVYLQIVQVKFPVRNISIMLTWL